MKLYDFSPLNRYGVGFDRIMNALESAVGTEETGYPPYDILRTGEDSYRITLVVPGLNASDINIEAQQNLLTVSASSPAVDGERTYLHQGISLRSFKRSFQLADHVIVTNARMENGLLHIDIVREIPEALKPRRIEIAGVDSDSATSVATRDAA